MLESWMKPEGCSLQPISVEGDARPSSGFRREPGEVPSVHELVGAGVLFPERRGLQVIQERRVVQFRGFGLGEEAVAHGVQTQRDVLGEVRVEQEDRFSGGNAGGDTLVSKLAEVDLCEELLAVALDPA